ncbi:chromatin assembly factor 1 subunit A-B [Drosophila miranda]|nr:chromatin assembly factor 1 subunit A-B [Drosophila miranda]
MPAGTLQTPSSKPITKDAIQKSGERTCTTGSSGKKLVQTRLPFKLITPVASTATGGTLAGSGAGGAPTSATSSGTSALPDGDALASEESPLPKEPRKRRLSYSEEKSSNDDTSELEQQRRSNSKENLAVGVAGAAAVGAAKKSKILEVLDMAEEIIELDDDDDADEDIDEKEKPEEKKSSAPALAGAKAKIQIKPKAKPKPKPKTKPGKKAPSSPIQIKLPLLSKRGSKRRKSVKESEAATPKETAPSTATAVPVDCDSTDDDDDAKVIAEKRMKVRLPKGKKDPEAAAEKRQKDGKKPEAEESKEEETKTKVNGNKNDQEEVLNAVEKITAEVLQTVEEITEEKNIKEQKNRGQKTEPKTKDAQTLTSSKQEDQQKAEKKKTPNAKKHDSKSLEKSTKEETELSTERATKEDSSLKENVSKADLEVTEKSSKEQDQQSGVQQNSHKEEKQTTDEKREDETENKDDSPDDDEVTILSSSDSDREKSDQSSTDHEMEMDTDTPDRRANGGKGKASRRKSVHDMDGVDGGGDLKGQALTPKQQRLFEQRRKAREEKEHKLQEERRLKQQEKEQREQQRKLERDQKEEQRRKERDEKEEQRRKEREEKERKRQAEVDSKNEEKRKRNEAKEEVQRKRDEEKRRKEHEKEEAEQKKKRAAESFTKFFVQKQPKGPGTGDASAATLEQEHTSCESTKMSCQSLAFRPFQVKDDMLLAPVVRASLGGQQRSQLDGLFRERNEDASSEEEEPEDIGRRKRPNRVQLYLAELAKGTRQPLKMQRDIRLQRRTKEEESEEEVQVIDDLTNAGTPIVQEEQAKQMPRMRAKYLMFADNRRPPYYGTWRKKSQSICARRPLAQDKVHFDYEVDSDCEWEEEEPGESLSASEDEKERESEEESEEEYNEWYVPHGHLSDEELQNDGEMDDGHTREAQKAKLQVLQQEFAQEMKKQTRKIKPRLLGPVWLDENGNKSQLCPPVFIQTIDMYGSWQLEPISLEPPPEAVREEATSTAPPSPLQLDERLLQQLVRLTHGNRNAKAFLISEYLEYLKTQTSQEAQLLPSKALIREKFDELATWSTMELSTPDAAAGSSAKKSKKPKKRLCWMVGPEMLEKFQLAELSVQNQWEYTLTPKITESETPPQHELSPPAEPEVPAKQDKESPVAPVDASSTPSTPTQVAPKKRVALISGPRELPSPAASKNGLISQFLRRQSDASPSTKASPKRPTAKASAAESEVVLLLSD